MSGKPEVKNRTELDKLLKRVADMEIKLKEQGLAHAEEKESLEKKLEKFEDIKDLLPEAERGIAICRRESPHAGLKFVFKEKYKCIKSKDQTGQVWYKFFVPYQSPKYKVQYGADGMNKEYIDGYVTNEQPYNYHAPTFYRYFDYLPEEGEMVLGEEFMKEFKRKQRTKK